MTRPLEVSGLAALLVVEAGIGIFCIVPDVPPVYRAFLIERTSACVPADPPGTFTPGRSISFARSGDTALVEDILVCGLANATPDGTWTVGPEARLRFRHDGPLRITFEARAADIERSLRLSTGDVFTIGPELSAYTVLLPPPLAGTSELVLHVDPLPTATDARWRGILIGSLRPDPA